ncbi:BnaA05g10370D [Brassica napus]|uniref:BnaA05g10370D protein n=1 Tax=Brassica napus TaxID=3708 RepID=A0A078FW46_BRANA|nr:BnaA05g10370D [Brassica napus]
MSRNVDWSKLCPDLLRSIFESLSSLDFHRAKTVCSNWYTVSRTSNDGDKGWRITCTQCEDMAYKDNKLYVYTFDHYINVLDFSGDCPKETIEGNHYLNHPFPFVDTIYKMRIAIANSGEVLIMLIFGHGVTIRGPVKDRGIKSGSICFLDDDHLSDNYLGTRREANCGVFDLATRTITWHTRLDDWSSKIYWFVPGQA